MSDHMHPASAPPGKDGGPDGLHPEPPPATAIAPGSARPRVPLLRLRRALIAGATAFLSINLWTGAPLLALWVGSQAADEQTLSMSAVVVVVLVLAVLTVSMAVALLWLEARYRRLVGHPLRENRLAWLRAFNAEAEVGPAVPMSMVEQIVTFTVYVAVIALIVWFLLFAGSPVPHG
jgi:hypothetical protein